MILYAININSGGGKILLDELIVNHPLGEPKVLFIDERYGLPIKITDKELQIRRVKPKLIYRWCAELALLKVSKQNPQMTVLCFGNLPPAFRLPSKTIMYLQNAFLLPKISIPKDSIKIFLRIFYERVWFKFFINNVDQIWVQTKWMRDSLPNAASEKIFIKPILPSFPAKPETPAKTIDFISVTGSLRYKNLIPLLEAIKSSGLINCKFVIISDSRSSEIDSLIQEIKSHKMDLDFYTNLNRDAVFKLIAKSKCMVITSTIESFCLPLHEAIYYNLDIISGNFPFVTEYTTPKICLESITINNIKNALCLYSKV